MKRALLHFVRVFAFLAFVLMPACSTAPESDFAPTETRQVIVIKPSTPTPPPAEAQPAVEMPAATSQLPAEKPTPEPHLSLAWTLPIGELKFLAVLSDGTIHGFSPKIHAVISPQGQVVKADKVDLNECITDTYVGVGKITDHYYTRPDDAIILSGPAGFCLIEATEPLSIQKLGNGYLYPYADDKNQIVVIKANVSRPDGFEPGGIGGKRMLGYQSELDQLTNSDMSQIALPNHNGAYTVYSLPEDLDLSRFSNLARTSTEFFTQFVWDDLYMIYDGYDAIGNKTGQKTHLYRANGEQAELAAKPVLFDKLNYMTSSFKFKEFYNEEDKGRTLVLYGEDLSPLARYPLPKEMPTQSSLWGADAIHVGNDHAIYAVDEQSGAYTLYKWVIVGDSTLQDAVKTPAAVTPPNTDLPTEGWITFINMDGEVWAVRPDGNELSKISPDGIRINSAGDSEGVRGTSFYYYEYSNRDIFVWDSKSRETTTIKNMKSPSFDLSPDGKKLVIERNCRQQIPRLPTSKLLNDGLSVYDIETKQEEALPLQPSKEQMRFSDPKWSPDGKTIFFTVMDDTCYAQDSCSFGFYDFETQTVRFTPLLPGWFHRAVWSPDGTKIAVKLMDPLLDPGPNNLFLFDSKGGLLFAVDRPAAPVKDRFVGWLKNGEALAIQVSDKEIGRTDVFDLNTKTRQPLTDGRFIAISPDGKWAVHSSDSEPSLTLLNLTTSESFPAPIPEISLVYWVP